ncbi:acetyl-CoA hydrolase/transferase family protein [Rubeoparvulum massiliense]|uniref:acetyl-CoA hydrolase/transferase family protein n=1 Tax=Rubeoparvulum massiliense TaxID=1631346 RepID=UPI00065DC626|nr:acetyl-CoA hydrolase/transferase family protein [Rubeoparvulum massiliense]
MLEKRLRYQHYQELLTEPEKAIEWIHDGMVIGMSGFTRAGDAKTVPLALINYVKQHPNQIHLDIYTGASLGNDIDGMMAEVGLVHKRLPFQADPQMRKHINAGDMLFIDQHLSVMSENIRSHALPKIDVAIVEAVAITEDGSIIPTTSVGNTNLFVQQADIVIIEINTTMPMALEGMHDIYTPAEQGEREPIPLTSVDQRIGTTSIKVDPAKVKAVVISELPDSPSTIAEPDEETQQMANHLLSFLRQEVKAGRLPANLMPLQSGIGSVANAVLHGFLDSEFSDLTVYSEVLQDAVFDLLDAGKVSFASGCSITLSPTRMNEVYPKLGQYQDRVVLRPQEITNHPEVIRRLGLIAINTAIEADIYGNVNSTHVLGTKMMNGIGGSGDFARNSRLSIFATKSVAKGGNISSIVPFVSHVDHSEHDVDIIVTEQGIADLRGLAPRERAIQIIENCAHPDYRDQLRAYYDEALQRGGQTPHVLEKALSWHIQYAKTGSMKITEVVAEKVHQ